MWTEQFGLSRTFTVLGLDMDDEDAWSRRLYDEYGGSLKKGQEGDIPGRSCLFSFYFFYCSELSFNNAY